MSLFDSGNPATVGTGASRTPSTTTSTASKSAEKAGATSFDPTGYLNPIIGPNGAVSPSAPSTTAPPSGSGGDLFSEDPTRLFDQLRAQFPWLEQIGVDPSWFQEVAAETGGNADAVLVRFRELPQYRSRFAGMWRQDGSLRMNEAQYLATEEAYRQILRQAGFDENVYARPEDLVGIFQADIDPNELNERVQIHQQVIEGSQSVRDAFYVYAGIDVSPEDLFAAVVDPTAGANLSRQYTEAVAAQTFDYETFLRRAAEVAPQRAAALAEATDNDVSFTQLQSQQPELVSQILDLLYTNGGTETNPTLSLDELLASYEEALLGAAAVNAGLDIPTKDRISEIRLAGIDRSRAQQAYLQFAQFGGSLSGAAQRRGLGEIDQVRFEDASFFGEGSAQRALTVAAASEAAAGQRQGTFQFGQDRTGRFTQAGLTA